MKKILIFILLLSVLAIAAKVEDDNQDGSAYGSAVDRDTSYVSWNGQYYIYIHPHKEISTIFKLLIGAADTIIINTLGANLHPDSVRFYYKIRADTLYRTAAGADTLYGDSTIVVNLPYGTGVTASVIPVYLKYQVITADTASGGAATATIADGWVIR